MRRRARNLRTRLALLPTRRGVRSRRGRGAQYRHQQPDSLMRYLTHASNAEARKYLRRLAAQPRSRVGAVRRLCVCVCVCVCACTCRGVWAVLCGLVGRQVAPRARVRSLLGDVVVLVSRSVVEPACMRAGACACACVCACVCVCVGARRRTSALLRRARTRAPRGQAGRVPATAHARANAHARTHALSYTGGSASRARTTSDPAQTSQAPRCTRHAFRLYAASFAICNMPSTTRHNER